jgi:hypothetical protein
LFFLIAAGGYEITPSGKRILPATLGESILASRSISRNELILMQPVGRSYVAILDTDLAVTIAGKSFTLPKGTDLNVARVGGGAAANIADTRAVFCAASQNNWNMAKGLANLATLSLFARSQRHGVETQLCLVDADRDGMVEKAILAGANKSADQVPVEIAPTKISVMQDMPLPGVSQAQIRFSGKAGWLGNIAFDLEVIENGTPLYFQNGRTVLNPKDLPQTINIFGAILLVESYDKASQVAKIKVVKGFDPFEYGIQTTTTYVYIPG